MIEWSASVVKGRYLIQTTRMQIPTSCFMWTTCWREVPGNHDLYCGYWCSYHSDWQASHNNYPNAELWVAFGIGKHFPLLQHQHYLRSFRERKIPLPPSFSYIHRMWYHIYIFLEESRKQHGLHGMPTRRSMRLLSSCLRIVTLK